MREPLSVRAGGRPARGRRRRGDREHRHRRPDADPGGGQEPRLRRRGHQPGELRRRARGAARRRRRAVRAHAARAWPARRSPHRPLRRRDLALVRRARGGLPRAGHRSPTRRCSTSPTARTRTSGPRSTRRRARARTCCRWSRSSTARSCRSTTCSTWTPRGGWWRSSSCRRRRSSSTTTRAGAPWAPTRRMPSTKALATDRQSAFGGVMAFNRPVDRGAGRAAARDVRGAGVRARLRRRRARGARRRSRTCGCCADEERRDPPITEQDLKRVRGGMLVQDRDTGSEDRARHAGGHRAKADRGGVGRAAVRDARVQARAVERDRAGQGPRPRRAWARAR